MIWKRGATDNKEMQELKGLRAALDASQAVIWFDLDGTILKVNDNFCQAMSHDATRLVGQHHRIFMDPIAAKEDGYATFWKRLRKGEAFHGEVNRVTGDGRQVVLSAFYTPVKDDNGVTTKIVKVASDITEKATMLTALQSSLERLCNGDLSVRLDPFKDPDFQILSQQFNMTLERLENMVRLVDGVSQALSGEVSEITANARDLADRGEAQAATLEETAASLEELSEAVQGTANNAQLATQAAKTASDNAKRGTQVVSDAIGAMQEIKNGSNEISKIIEVIDSISFQTNLLALNAGIEAARAGDAGRGFAVVASEIRALAQRTAEAAKDISDLIVSSNANVATGAQLVDQTGDSLGHIGNEILQIVSNIEEISSATSEQADGIASVTHATSQIDIATQQNAVLSDQSAQGAVKVAHEASHLRELLDAFQNSGPVPQRNDGSDVPFMRSA